MSSGNQLKSAHFVELVTKERYGEVYIITVVYLVYTIPLVSRFLLC